MSNDRFEKNIDLLLLELARTARKYLLKNFKNKLTDDLRAIIDKSYDLIHRDSDAIDDFVNRLQTINKVILALNGKIGYDDYERFKEISENLDVHIVALTLKNA